MKVTRLSFMIASTILLSSCSSGPVIKNHTKETIDAGQMAIKQSSDFFDSLLILQNQHAAIIYATQPECVLNETNTIQIRAQNSGKSDLCASEKEIKSGNSHLLELTPLDKRRFQTDMEILQVFSDYLAALTTYTDDPKTPVANLLDKALTNANSIKQLQSLTSDQKTAVTGLATYLEKMIREYEQGKSISELVLTEGLAQQENIKNVEIDIDRMNSLYKESMMLADVNSLKNYYRNHINTTEFNSYKKREEFISKIDTLSQDINYSVSSPVPASVAIKKFMTYHQNLINIINGDYSEKVKKEKIEIERKQLIDGLKYVGEIVKPLVKSAISFA